MKGRNVVESIIDCACDTCLQNAVKTAACELLMLARVNCNSLAFDAVRHYKGGGAGGGGCEAGQDPSRSSDACVSGDGYNAACYCRGADAMGGTAMAAVEVRASR